MAKKSNSNIRIGLVARADNSGLGTMSWEFSNHLKPAKTLIVNPGKYHIFRERFPENSRLCAKGQMSTQDMEWLLDGIDLLLTIETPYHYALYKMAKRAGVKTVLIPMYECMPPIVPHHPDLYICPSEIDMDFVDYGQKKVLIPCPINIRKLVFKRRKRAETFVFHNGHGGGKNRNGAKEFIEAISLVKNKEVKFIIYSQLGLPKIDDPRVEVRIGNYENYYDIWQDGDVYVHPHKFDGLSLPIQEAIGVGMPVICTKFYPFTEWLPEHWMFPSPSHTRERIFHLKVDVHEVNPQILAAKIDAWAMQDITHESWEAHRLSRDRSWGKLKPKYLKEFKKLCDIS